MLVRTIGSITGLPTGKVVPDRLKIPSTLPPEFTGELCTKFTEDPDLVGFSTLD